MQIASSAVSQASDQAGGELFAQLLPDSKWPRLKLKSCLVVPFCERVCWLARGANFTSFASATFVGRANIWPAGRPRRIGFRAPRAAAA